MGGEKESAVVMANDVDILAGQLWKVKADSGRTWRDESHEVVSVSSCYFKDEYQREWAKSLLLDHYDLIK